jgi:hypothetical protein
MSVTSTNLIQGPATLYVGAFGVTEPLTVDAAPGAGWTDVGGTRDGVELTIAKSYAVLSVDQIVDEVGRTVTSRVVSVKTTLAEATLENFARAINETAPAAGVFTPDSGLDAFSPAYQAVLLDGIAPAGLRRRFIIRKVLATDSVGTAYKKDGMTVVPVTFTGHWVSASVEPFAIEDETA